MVLEHLAEKKDKPVRRVSRDKKERRIVKRKFFFATQGRRLSCVSIFKREKGLFLILLTLWAKRKPFLLILHFELLFILRRQNYLARKDTGFIFEKLKDLFDILGSDNHYPSSRRDMGNPV